MSLDVTLPANADLNSVVRKIISKYASLTGLAYNLNGTQLTIYELEETNRTTVESAIAEYTSDQQERQAVVASYQANLDFLALATPTTAQAVAQVKALTRQVNYLAKTLLG